MAAEFSARLKPGRYAVRIAYSAGSNRATQGPEIIHQQRETTRATLKQNQEPEQDVLTTIQGTFTFDESAKVVISNADTNGYVIVDAVQFLPAK
jgi:hypothetical protein